MTNTDTLKLYRQFRTNGGTPAGSLKCARAVVNMRAVGAYVDWENDWHIGSHVKEYGAEAYDREPDTCECAVLYDSDDNVLGSLGCIDDADGYCRALIEAELALEYLPSAGDEYVI